MVKPPLKYEHFRPQRDGSINGSKICVPHPDTSMSDILSEKSCIKGPVDEVSIAETKGVISQHPLFDPIAQILGDRFPLLDEGPVRFYPGWLSNF